MQFNKKAVVTVATAALRTMRATPVTLIEAPPAGWYIGNVRVIAKYIYGTAAFDSVGSSDDMEFRYTDGSGTKVANDIETTGWLDQTANGVRTSGPVNTSMTPLAATKVVATFGTGEIYSAAGDGSLILRATYDLLKA